MLSRRLDLFRQRGRLEWAASSNRGGVSACSVAEPSASVSSGRISPPRPDRRYGFTKQTIHSTDLPYGQIIYQKVHSSKSVELEVFGLCTSDSKRLTARLKAARSWAQLKDIIHQDAFRQADVICLSAAFSAIPKVLRKMRLTDACKQEVAQTVSVLVKLSRPKLEKGEFDAQGLVNVAVGLAKLEHADKELFTILVNQSRSHLPSFTPQALSNFIWALATAGHQPCGSWLTEFYRRVEATVELFNSQDIANLMWGLCRFDLMPDFWLMQQLKDRALDQLADAATGQDPATIITCLARYYYKYNYRPSDEWLYAFLEMVRPNLGSYLPFDLVSIVHSMVVMNNLPSRAWMFDFYVVLKDRLMFDPALSYSDFQRLMWALSRIDYTPTQSWLRAFVEVSISKLKHLKYRALAELIWALACWDCKLSKEWVDEYFRVTEGKLDEYKPRHIANTLSALSKLGCRVPSRWLDRALAAFCSQLDDVKAHDLVTLLDTITTVCQDKKWLSQQSKQRTIKELADVAASKFEIYDAVMHSKLLLFLAASNFYPGVEWLQRQQASLVKCWSSEDVDTRTVQNLQQVYSEWDVELNQELDREFRQLRTP